MFQVNFKHKLVEVSGEKREAVFELLADGGHGEIITVPVGTHTHTLSHTHILDTALSMYHSPCIF